MEKIHLYAKIQSPTFKIIRLRTFFHIPYKLTTQALCTIFFQVRAVVEEAAKCIGMIVGKPWDAKIYLLAIQ